MSGNKFTTDRAPTNARIDLKGTITVADRGIVGIFSPHVSNSGTITANLGQVTLGGVQTTVVDFTGDGLMTFEGGNVTIQAVNGSITESGSIDASGALGGGDVKVWATENAGFNGNIKAEALANSQGAYDGGFVEVSGLKKLGFSGNVSTLSLSGGKVGTLLLDPTDITVDSTGTGSFSAIPAGEFTISAATVLSILRSNHLILSATNSITINQEINWSWNNTTGLPNTAASVLTLSAGAGGVTVDQSITSSASGGLVITTTGGGAVNLNAGIDVNSLYIGSSGKVTGKAEISNGTGALTINAVKDISITGGISSSNYSSLAANPGNATITSTTGNVSIASISMYKYASDWTRAVAGSVAINAGNGANIGNVVLNGAIDVNALTINASGWVKGYGSTTIHSGGLSITAGNNISFEGKSTINADNSNSRQTTPGNAYFASINGNVSIASLNIYKYASDWTQAVAGWVTINATNGSVSVTGEFSGLSGASKTGWSSTLSSDLTTGTITNSTSGGVLLSSTGKLTAATITSNGSGIIDITSNGKLTANTIINYGAGGIKLRSNGDLVTATITSIGDGGIKITSGGDLYAGLITNVGIGGITLKSEGNMKLSGNLLGGKGDVVVATTGSDKSVTLINSMVVTGAVGKSLYVRSGSGGFVAGYNTLTAYTIGTNGSVNPMDMYYYGGEMMRSGANKAVNLVNGKFTYQPLEFAAAGDQYILPSNYTATEFDIAGNTLKITASAVTDKLKELIVVGGGSVKLDNVTSNLQSITANGISVSGKNVFSGDLTLVSNGEVLVNGGTDNHRAGIVVTNASSLTVSGSLTLDQEVSVKSTGTGYSAYGIFIDRANLTAGQNLTLIQNGTISATGQDGSAYGIDIVGRSSGVVTLTAGNDINFTQNGAISSSGSSAYGILLDGSNNDNKSTARLGYSLGIEFADSSITAGNDIIFDQRGASSSDIGGAFGIDIYSTQSQQKTNSRILAGRDVRGYQGGNVTQNYQAPAIGAQFISSELQAGYNGTTTAPGKTTAVSPTITSSTTTLKRGSINFFQFGMIGSGLASTFGVSSPYSNSKLNSVNPDGSVDSSNNPAPSGKVATTMRGISAPDSDSTIYSGQAVGIIIDSSQFTAANDILLNQFGSLDNSDQGILLISRGTTATKSLTLSGMNSQTSTISLLTNGKNVKLINASPITPASRGKPAKQPDALFKVSYAKDLHIDLGGGVFNAGNQMLDATNLHLILAISNQSDNGGASDSVLLKGGNGDGIAIQLGSNGSFTRVTPLTGSLTIDGSTSSYTELNKYFDSNIPLNVLLGDSGAETTQSVGIKVKDSLTISGVYNHGEYDNSLKLDWIEGGNVRVTGDTSFNNSVTIMSSGKFAKIQQASAAVAATATKAAIPAVTGIYAGITIEANLTTLTGAEAEQVNSLTLIQNASNVPDRKTGNYSSGYGADNNAYGVYVTSKGSLGTVDDSSNLTIIQNGDITAKGTGSAKGIYIAGSIYQDGATSYSFGKLKADATATLSLLPMQAAKAAPQGGVVVGGDINATISTTGLATNINQTANRAAINWTSFNVAPTESVNFTVPNNGATLNTVTGNAASLIQGTVTSNGTLYLVNPNGFVFDTGSKVHAQNFVATTGTIDATKFWQTSLAKN
eukprot:Em0263g6a